LARLKIWDDPAIRDSVSWYLDVVGDLDTGSMRKRTPYFEQGQRYT
jgi:hypothetical protein